MLGLRNSSSLWTEVEGQGDEGGVTSKSMSKPCSSSATICSGGWSITSDPANACGVVVTRLSHTQEDPGSTPRRGSYLRQVSLH